MTDSQFLFIELAEDALTEGHAFDGVAFGTFTDMLGREIELKASDAEKYVENTASAIEATRAESGEVVGLPIDAQGHEKGDGAGWIVGVELVDKVIRLLPKWTEIGRELISKGIRRFFSATIDIKNKVVLGGTLTNWPASRDAQNRVMLRPIELEDGGGLQTINVNLSEQEQPKAAPLTIGENNMAEDKVITLVEVTEDDIQDAPPASAPDIAPDDAAELMKLFTKSGQQEPEEFVKAMQKQADLIAQKRVDRMLNERDEFLQVTNLAAQLTGGGVYGLTVPIVELTSFLQSLDVDQFKAAKSIFETIAQTGVIDFAERGHGRRLRKKQLPADYHVALKEVLAAGSSVVDFFQAVNLGDGSDYDLSQFGGK